MATFKVVVRKKRADGFYPVYIRVVHRSRMGYIKTDKLITDKQITKNGEIKDIVVNEYCSREILRYSDMINRKDVSNYFVLLFNFAVYPLKASLQIFIYWLSAPDISMFNLCVENIKLLKIKHLTNSFMLTLVNLTR